VAADDVGGFGRGCVVCSDFGPHCSLSCGGIDGLGDAGIPDGGICGSLVVLLG